MASHLSESIPGVVDMSAGSNGRSSLSIYVGPERRQFILPGHFLGKKSIDLDLLLQRCGSSPSDPSGATDSGIQEFQLDTVDLKAFNLFVQWLYGIELPQVQPAWPSSPLSLDDGRLSEVPQPAHLQSSGALIPLVQNENPTGSVQNSFRHIVFRWPYRKFSAEEIRLADMLRSSAETGDPDKALLATTSTEESTFKWFS
ncbi:hypothetical protein PG993_000926 [Apiospora rasikravindrae]|uniref:BTB domain-containing protein n=1 Tax=Apiospora rasikravindrae TaxID=990691 RepID=A0ABR1UCS1_9PEZI